MATLPGVYILRAGERIVVEMISRSNRILCPRRFARSFSELTHVDHATGKPQMVDVSSKATTVRTAIAKVRANTQ